MNFGRIITAMVTPFDENGALDVERTRELVNYLIDNGTDALVVAGTTGESPTLTHEEKLLLFETVVDEVKGRIPVIAGTGSNNTQASIELTKEAERIGADAIMLVAPYYNKPSQEGLYAHFSAIAKETKLPIMLYNIPGRSVIKLTAETTLRLAQIPNIVMTKEASGDLEMIAEIIENAPEGFSVYSGDDSMTLPILSIGGKGVVSVASHIIGNELQTMIQRFENGDVKRAAADHRRLLPLMNACFYAPNPTAVKALLELKGIKVGTVRLPLTPLSDEQRAALKEILHSYENVSLN